MAAAKPTEKKPRAKRATGNPVGRPSKFEARKKKPFKVKAPKLQLTEKLANDFAKLISEGKTQSQAAGLLGIPASRVTQWLYQGRLDLEAERFDTDVARFAFLHDQASAHMQAEIDETLQHYIHSNTRATEALSWAKWRLSVANPHEYTERGANDGNTGALSSAKIQEALESVQAKLRRFLATSEETDAQDEETNEEKEETQQESDQ